MALDRPARQIATPLKVLGFGQIEEGQTVVRHGGVLEGVDPYVHTQGSPTTTWTITHNLGRYPSVTVVDSGGTVVHGGIAYVSVNQLVVTFSAAFSGKAFLN